eukprot:6456983-Amphidinium_carterae.1
MFEEASGQTRLKCCRNRKEAYETRKLCYTIHGGVQEEFGKVRVLTFFRTCVRGVQRKLRLHQFTIEKNDETPPKQLCYDFPSYHMYPSYHMSLCRGVEKKTPRAERQDVAPQQLLHRDEEPFFELVAGLALLMLWTCFLAPHAVFVGVRLASLSDKDWIAVVSDEMPPLQEELHQVERLVSKLEGIAALHA